MGWSYSTGFAVANQNFLDNAFYLALYLVHQFHGFNNKQHITLFHRIAYLDKWWLIWCSCGIKCADNRCFYQCASRSWEFLFSAVLLVQQPEQIVAVGQVLSVRLPQKRTFSL